MSFDPKKITAQDMREIAQSAGEKSRVDSVRELLRIYRHEWLRDLDKRLQELFTPQTWKRLRLKADISLNLLRWAVDQLSPIYAEPATRRFGEGSDDQTEEQTQSLEYYEQGGLLDMALDQIAHLVSLCRTVFVRPLVLSETSWVLDVVTPDRITVLPSEKDPMSVSAVVVRLPLPMSEKKKRGVLDRAYAFWTSDEWCYLNESWEVIGKVESNPYGVIPYLPIHATFPAVGFWQEQDSFGLREATYKAGVAMTDHQHLRHLQSFKQIVISGDPSGEDWANLLADPSSAIQLKAGGSASILDMQADLVAHLEGILTQASAVLNLYGIRPESVRGTMDASSGYALAIKNQGLHRAWGRLRRVFVFAERQIYNLLRTVARVDVGVDLCADPLVVEHADLSVGSDPQQQASTYSTLVTAGILSRAQVRREMDYSDEQSEQIEIETREESASSDPLKGLL